MFDENDAIEYINAYLQNSFGITYDEDEILNVIDIIWDYYEDNDLIDIDSDSELDFDDLVASVKKTLSRDKGSKISADHIDSIVSAEIEYEDSLDLDD